MMRQTLSAHSLVLVFGLALSSPASAGLPLGDPCALNEHGAEGLIRDGDFSKLWEVMINRCSNAGIGNGGEMQLGPGSIVRSKNFKEAGDTDPGNSGATNQAGNSPPANSAIGGGNAAPTPRNIK